MAPEFAWFNYRWTTRENSGGDNSFSWLMICLFKNYQAAGITRVAECTEQITMLSRTLSSASRLLLFVLFQWIDLDAKSERKSRLLTLQQRQICPDARHSRPGPLWCETLRWTAAQWRCTLADRKQINYMDRFTLQPCLRYKWHYRPKKWKQNKGERSLQRTKPPKGEWKCAAW